MIKLRPYQAETIAALRSKYANLKKLLLVAPTGSGKSVVMAEILRSVRDRGKRGLLVVRGRSLVAQASAGLDDYDIQHGVFMSNHFRYRPHELINVCSIDTLFARKIAPPADFLCIDECFPAEMEILTDRGFVRFDCLTKTELVAQFDDKTRAISFCKPLEYIKREVRNHGMVTVSGNRHIDVTATENHEFVYYRESTGARVRSKIKDVCFGGGDIRVFKAGFASGTESFLTPNEKMMIAFQADGHDQSASRIYFTFTKQRKIDELMALLADGNFSWGEIKGTAARGNVGRKRRFSVYWHGNKSKIIADHFCLSELSAAKCREIIEYMVLWDGSKISDSTYYYSSAIKENADFFQAVAMLAGYSSKITLQHDNRSSNYRTMHRLFITKKKDNVSSQGMVKTRHIFSGTVYCVSVPTGNIIVRRSGSPIVIGNCHLSQGAGYRWLIDQYPGAYFLSVTATPFLKKGLRHVADDYVALTSMATLIEQGYLSPLKYYCPTVIDISGIKTNRGDYDEKELYKAVDKAPIYGDLVKSYRDYLPGKTALAFGVNVAHAKKIAAEFNASGIACGYVDANVDLAERNAIVERLKRRELYVISSVGTMTTGIDIPCLDGLIIARPTKSLNLHLQILGRASRVYPGKSHGIILDHAGNVIRLGLAEAERPINLDGFTPKEPEIPVITCEKCYSVFCPYQNHLKHFGEKKTNAKSRFYVCPSCGHNNQPKRSREEMAIENVNSEMREVTAEDLIIADYAALELLREKTKSKSGKKYHRNWSVYRLLTKYSETQIKTALPEVLKAFHASKKHSS